LKVTCFSSSSLMKALTSAELWIVIGTSSNRFRLLTPARFNLRNEEGNDRSEAGRGLSGLATTPNPKKEGRAHTHASAWGTRTPPW